MIGTPLDFVLPPDRIVDVFTKGVPKRFRLATEPSGKGVDRDGNEILLWGKSDMESTYGARIKRGGHGKGKMK